MAKLRNARHHAVPDFSVSRRELLALPARLLTRLPLETRIFAQASGSKAEFVLTTAPDVAPSTLRIESRGPCWLTAPEVEALVLGVEAERTFASDLTGFALRKLHDRSFRVTREHALDDAQPGDDLRALTVGEVLEALDLEVTGIELGPLPSSDVAEPAPARAA